MRHMQSALTCALREAAEMMKRVNYTPEERRIADDYIYHKMRRVSEDEYVREQGREQGREEGIQLGREEERAKYEEERTKVKAEKLEIAANLLQTGMSAEEVAKHMKLSIDDVNPLVQQFECTSTAPE